ncbi:PREDICTED: enkurin [Ceratosolen solmsi marchali]|uniref:Enkurin n=1 Tax=Ceratosolen solmsi marchali TaxID=326594 RepID=A0AAJ6YQC5_9HYME|nr:PREDICTED: enkurin [Ceratosolen solmsi marchali]
MAINLNAKNDNIINLIEKPKEKFIKSPRYQSIHKERMKREIANTKSEHKTFGVPKVSLNLPSDFLKKNHLNAEKPKVNHVHYRRPNYQHNLPKWTPIKMRTTTSYGQFPEFPHDPLKIGRLNFRKRNIENVKNFAGKHINLNLAYTRHGDNHDLIRSGLIPIYIHKKNFGVVPTYLRKGSFTKCPNKKRQDQTDELNEQHSYGKSCRYVTQDEKAKLVKEMKKKWAEIMKQFQCLPFLIDTVAKIKRKITIEQKLNQLEKDIELLENHQYIYVYDDADIKQ